MLPERLCHGIKRWIGARRLALRLCVDGVTDVEDNTEQLDDERKLRTCRPERRQKRREYPGKIGRGRQSGNAGRRNEGNACRQSPKRTAGGQQKLQSARQRNGLCGHCCFSFVRVISWATQLSEN